MTTNNWREEFEKIYNENSCKAKFLAFIETQIAQARREEREKVKKELFNFVDNELKLLGYEHKTIIDKISTL